MSPLLFLQMKSTITYAHSFRMEFFAITAFAQRFATFARRAMLYLFFTLKII